VQKEIFCISQVIKLKIMIKKSTAFAASLLLICIACNNKAKEASDVVLARIEQKSPEKDMVADSIGAPQQEPQRKPQQTTDKTVKSQSIEWNKKIIKTANLNAEVKDYKTFSARINDKVKKYGGYISQEEQSQDDYKVESAIVIKVPVDQFEMAVNDLLSDAEKTNEKRIASDDVTTELIDGKSRLEAKRQIRLRYLDLLKQARNMQEILSVQSEINDIQEEIETTAGRINFLGHSAAMSTINFTFYQVLNASANTPDDISFLAKSLTAFKNGLYWLGEFFVVLIGLWPFLLLVAIGIYLFKKRMMIKF
jgi:hypothetical protein